MKGFIKQYNLCFLNTALQSLVNLGLTPPNHPENCNYCAGGSTCFWKLYQDLHHRHNSSILHLNDSIQWAQRLVRIQSSYKLGNFEDAEEEFFRLLRSEEPPTLPDRKPAIDLFEIVWKEQAICVVCQTELGSEYMADEKFRIRRYTTGNYGSLSNPELNVRELETGMFCRTCNKVVNIVLESFTFLKISEYFAVVYARSRRQEIVTVQCEETVTISTSNETVTYEFNSAMISYPGHWIGIVKKDEHYYCCNDDVVTTISKEEALSNFPVTMVIYKKQAPVPEPESGSEDYIQIPSWILKPTSQNQAKINEVNAQLEERMKLKRKTEDPVPVSGVPSAKKKIKRLKKNTFLKKTFSSTSKTKLPHKKGRVVIRGRWQKSSDGKYHCPEPKCNASFKVAGHLGHHWKAHQVRKKSRYSCPACSFTCWDISSLRRHVLHDHNPVSDEQKKKLLESSRVFRKNFYKCETCGLVIKTRRGLTNHMKIHDPTRTGDFVCELCAGARFKTNALYLNHCHRWHAELVGRKCEDELFHCKDCDAGFESRAQYAKHRMFHRKDAPGEYTCSFCNATFMNATRKNQHEKEDHHTGGRSNRLPVVRYKDNEYVKSVALGIEDLKIISSQSDAPESQTPTLPEKRKVLPDADGKFHCKAPKCDAIFSTAGGIVNHMTVHDPLAPGMFICLQCGAKYQNYAPFTRHLKYHHPKSQEPSKSVPVTGKDNEPGKTFERRRPVLGYLPRFYLYAYEYCGGDYKKYITSKSTQESIADEIKKDRWCEECQRQLPVGESWIQHAVRYVHITNTGGEEYKLQTFEQLYCVPVMTNTRNWCYLCKSFVDPEEKRAHIELHMRQKTTEKIILFYLPRNVLATMTAEEVVMNLMRDITLYTMFNRAIRLYCYVPVPGNIREAYAQMEQTRRRLVLLQFKLDKLYPSEMKEMDYFVHETIIYDPVLDPTYVDENDIRRNMFKLVLFIYILTRKPVPGLKCVEFQVLKRQEWRELLKPYFHCWDLINWLPVINLLLDQNCAIWCPREMSTGVCSDMNCPSICHLCNTSLVYETESQDIFTKCKYRQPLLFDDFFTRDPNPNQLLVMFMERLRKYIVGFLPRNLYVVIACKIGDRLPGKYVQEDGSKKYNVYFGMSIGEGFSICHTDYKTEEPRTSLGKLIDEGYRKTYSLLEREGSYIEIAILEATWIFIGKWLEGNSNACFKMINMNSEWVNFSMLPRETMLGLVMQLQSGNTFIYENSEDVIEGDYGIVGEPGVIEQAELHPD